MFFSACPEPCSVNLNAMSKVNIVVIGLTPHLPENYVLQCIEMPQNLSKLNSKPHPL